MWEQGPDGQTRLTRTWIIFFEKLGLPVPSTQRYTITWGAAIGGSLSTGTNKAPLFIVRRPGTCMNIDLICKTAPTGANAVFDINRNGGSILGPNKLVLPAGVTTRIETAQFSQPDLHLEENDILTLDVDQVGSTAAGGDVTIELLVQAD
jgi:hypothetical protein